MSLLFNAVQANPQQSVFAAYGSGGGGSYPVDASFNTLNITQGGTLNIGSSINQGTSLRFFKDVSGTTASLFGMAYSGTNLGLCVRSLPDFTADQLRVGDLRAYGDGNSVTQGTSVSLGDAGTSNLGLRLVDRTGAILSTYATFASNDMTLSNLTSINGSPYPPAIGEVSVIRTGVLNFNAPTGNVTFSTPFSARPTITVQPTTLPPWSGGVEGSGLFYIESADSNGFRVGFSGNIAFFDPMPLMWIAVGS